MGWKYIVIRTPTHDIPVIFPDCLVHKDVAISLSRTKPLRDVGAEVISAGELYVLANGVGGESTTLEIKSRGEDDQRLIDSMEYGARGLRDLY